MSGPSGRPASAPALCRLLEAYYARYYRDTLGIREWRALVAIRVDDEDYEARRLARLEAALGAPIRGRRLLNVGCGPGGFNVAAERAGARTWGVDADPEAVVLAAGRIGCGHVVCAEAERLPLASSSVDVVYCYSTLEHVVDAERAVGEMLRVLRPDGRLYLHAPNPWACYEGHYKVVWLPGLPRWLARRYLGLRGRPVAFLDTLRPQSLRRYRRFIEAAGGQVLQVLDGDRDRPIGGRLWPILRLHARLLGVASSIELVAARGARSGRR
jgi:SAM-dependent methyltransferase